MRSFSRRHPNGRCGAFRRTLALLLAALLAGCWPGDDGRQAVDPGDNQAPDPALMTPRQPAAEAVAMATASPSATAGPRLEATATSMAQLIASAVAATLAPQATATATAWQPLPATPTHAPRATRTPAAPPDRTTAGDGLHFPAVVASKGLNLRRGPGAGYDIVGSYVQGTTVSAVGRSSDGAWLLVETPDERTGWMATAYLQIAENALDALPIAEP